MIKKVIRGFFALFLLQFLVACGGSDNGCKFNDTCNDASGDGGTDGSTTSTVKLSLKLFSSETGDQISYISKAHPGTIEATVTGAKTNDPLLVSFSPTIGKIAENGKSLTNAGVATIGLLADDQVGAGNVTASVVVDGKLIEATLVFGVQDDGSVSPSGAKINLKLISKTTGNEVTYISPDEPVSLVATVEGVTGTQIVSFTSTKGDVSNAGSTLTNASNVATLDLSVANAVGAGEATASVTTGGVVITGRAVFEVISVASSITLKLVSAVTGTETKFISITNPGRLVATVAGISKPVIATFTATRGSLSNSGTVLTDASGVASVDLIPDETTGAGTAGVAVSVGGIQISGSIEYEVKVADAVNAGKRLQFVSASPETITIKGTGADESSIVAFLVTDENGNAVKGQTITFSLNTTTGGIELEPATAVSDASGIVRVIVRSGTVATSVRVTAAIMEGSTVKASAQSSKLIIATGIPDQDSFSLSASVQNPEAWNVDGAEVIFTASVGDASNNPAPNGTSVYFTTEGGVIEPSCQTEGGRCSVKWRSSNPRPLGKSMSDAYPHEAKSLGQPYAGRVTVLATTIGEESFPDKNNNGRFDASELTYFLAEHASAEPFDLPEAFVDANEDGIFGDAAGSEAGGELEELVDFYVNGNWDDKDGKYNGSLCSVPAHAGCSAKKTITLRREYVLVMSTSSPYISTEILGDIYKICMSDLHNQPMPAGTDVVLTFSGALGTLAKLGDEKTSPVTYSYEWPNTSAHGPVCWYRNIVAGYPTDDVLSLEVKTPSDVRIGLVYSM